MTILKVRNLNVYFNTLQGKFAAVREFDLDIDTTEILSIVGESGSGKTVSMLAIMNLLGSSAQIEASEIRFEDTNLLELTTNQRRKFLGSKIGMIFQDPVTSLNPCYKVGDQLIELFNIYKNISRKKAKNKVIELFERVGISEASSRINSYPHQLSGGMNQRVMIAMAIALNPKLLIADEPTTALDVTIQAQILSVLKSIKESTNMAIILITHDMGVVAHMADRVVSMYRGWQVETNTNESIFSKPLHPYTKDLLATLPEISVGSKLKTIVNINNVETDGLNGCIYYPYCTQSSKKCLVKIEQKKFQQGQSYRCIL